MGSRMGKVTVGGGGGGGKQQRARTGGVLRLSCVQH
jgi:hypothetical protein